MAMEPAARVEDEIAHGYGMLAMVGGALVGVAAGVAVVGAIGLTGGLAAVAIAGAVAGGGLAGDQIASGLETIFNLPEPTTGVLTIGSPNVFVNGRAAIRAELSSAGGCSGAPFNHFTMSGAVIVREGSASVFINGQPASRLKSKLMCGAHIKSASPDVLIGGETVQTGFVFDLEAWTRSGLQILGIGALVGAGVFAAMAGAAAFGAFAGIGALGYAGMEGVGMIGDAIGPGYRDLLQGLVGMGMVVSGPKLAREGSIASERAKITELSNQGKIADARAILQRHVDAGDVDGIVRRLDVSSPRDGGHLRSGNGAAAKAEATRTGGVTLEGTPGGRVIDDWPDLGKKLPWDQGGKQLWGGASRNYTKGLSGDVRVLQTPKKAALGGGDIFKEYELPELDKGLRSGRITGITYDPTLPEPPPRP
ncbi:PAAR domain-containing protein [Sphingomonas mucosissima]|uniref:PAAR motif protein n=1 Tax=Sphingomonas mucosissima TaxID=370959 RepID=A0A245ZJ77_9SPHN|nr:PAAR domain-containing protein [Sphingomonas mucosissima]OWK29802.1 PAAR motif protein [Sphingomonas mucosissima]